MSPWPDKFRAEEQLPQAWSHLPRPWVFTNGVFDILHRGHVTYLAQARRLGASLIVAVNSDASVRMLGKGAGNGPKRPLNRDIDRVWVLAALQDVSALTLFGESTPLPLLQRLRPDVYVKGGDYDMARLAESALMKTWGGTCVAAAFEAGYSTTALVERIVAQHGLQLVE